MLAGALGAGRDSMASQSGPRFDVGAFEAEQEASTASESAIFTIEQRITPCSNSSPRFFATRLERNNTMRVPDHRPQRHKEHRGQRFREEGQVYDVCLGLTASK